ncbi:MAG: hypothetical protein ACT4PL_12520, partial [Phycisphaerales bacterium]
MPFRASRLVALPLILSVSALAAPAFGQCSGFNMTPSSGAAIVPGVTDIGNHCDDCNTTIALPFAVNIYGVNYTSASASSNGNLQFTTTSGDFNNACLPQAASLGVALVPHWDDLRTDGTAGEGIFTSVSGVAPSRVFNIEWRTRYFSGAGTANFEVRLFEDQSRVEMIYANISAGGTGATVGARHTLFPASQFACNTGGLFSGLKIDLACTNSPTPPGGTGSSTPPTVFACNTNQTALLTVNVMPGASPTSTDLAVVANLQSIGGSATQTFYNDGTHGDAVANDAIHSFSAVVTPAVTPGPKVLLFTVADAQGRSNNGTISLVVDPCPTRGPDVFVANLIDMNNYGTVGNITAYSVGTDACNMGDVPVNWFASVNQHPVIAQNMFRLKNGRFEQLGQSWLKHGFSSTNSGTCGTCTQPPLGGTQLGVNCSDAYGAGLNGSQGNGPRSQVNPTTSEYPYPFSAPAAAATIGRRLQVFTADVDPAQNAGAQYYVECHYVTYDDARWSNSGAPSTNGLNNASYRRISIPSTTGVPSFVGGTVQRTPAIFAWKAAEPSVQIANADYLQTTPLSDGGIMSRFLVAVKVTDNGNGTWHYEYAVHNLNADRCGGSFSVPRAPGTIISNIGFHGVFAHSGEPYPNTATNPANWSGVVTPDAVTWSCAPFVGPNGDNANAIRWGTLYNFRFDANIAPVLGAATVGLFKPGTPTTAVAAGLSVPGLPCNGPCCPTDFNGDGIAEPGDLDEFITAFFSDNEAERAECDFNGDGFIEPG